MRSMLVLLGSVKTNTSISAVSRAKWDGWQESSGGGGGGGRNRGCPAMASDGVRAMGSGL
jgi:hypothetical protein